MAQVVIDDRPDELPISMGANLTLRAAERHASRRGTAAVAPSHLLVAILERPDPRVKAFLAERHASVDWLRDAALAGVIQIGALAGPSIETIIAAARAEAQAEGHTRVDDLSLLKALLRNGDELSNRLLAEAGLLGAVETASTGRMWDEINALVAAPGAFSPRIGRASWTAPVRQSRWQRNVRALLGAIEVSPLFLLMLAVVVGSALLLATDDAAGREKALIATFIVSTYLVSLCLHEFGHAAAAYLTGERRVKEQGYLTLDLRRYSNPLLTFVLPMISLLAGRLPLPGGCVWLQPSWFRTVREDRFISAAGPAANFFCLMALSVPLRLGVDPLTPLGFAISGAASLQAGVFLFNLLPVPPLDGWAIFSAGSPRHVREQAAALGWMPLIALVVAFSTVPGLGWAYWSCVEGLGAMFGVDWLSAAIGRGTLYFR